MKLSSYLNEDYILIKDDLSDKDDILSFIIRMIEKNYGFKLNHEEVLRIIEERETLGGTVLPNGLWIPHGRIDNLNDIIVSVYVPKNKFVYCDTEIKLVTLFLVGKKTSNLYLKMLSGFAQLSQDENMYKSLIEAETPKKIISIVEKSGVQVSSSSTVSDIMTKDPISLSMEDNLKKVTDIFYTTGISYLPVVDATGKLIGEVTTLDVLKEGIPNYAMMVDSLAFLSTLEPFDKLLENEDKILVKNIMRKPSVKISPDSSIIEAALEMTQHNRRQLPVVKDGKILGIISYMDIIKKVLRA